MSAAPQAGSAGYGAARLAEETRERFIREIVARVPMERIVEVHCFPAIRQGGVETGVAVVAAVQLPDEGSEAAPAPDVAPEAAVDAVPAPEASTADAASAEDGAMAATDEAACDPTDDAAGPSPAEAVAAEDDAGIGTGVGTGVDAGVAADVAAIEEPSMAASATADGVTWSDASEEPPLETASMDEVLGEEVPVDVESAPPTRVGGLRHTIFTARYRLTLKGPDRGRWMMDVVEEADAPLVTVEAVVRGVQRRAGDAADPERLTAADVAPIVARGPAVPPPPPARPAPAAAAPPARSGTRR